MNTERPALRELEILEAVAREGNFSLAARALGLTRADVSRTVARLEQRLDLRLFTRTTRQVVPTEAARELVARVGPALREIGAALDAASERERDLAGTIRLSCSHAFGRRYLLPPLADFCARHPGVDIQLSLNDHFDDLLARQLDIAVRLGPLPDSSMVARRIGRVDVVLVAAPGLITGTPKMTREQVAGLPAIAFRVPQSGERRPWRLRLGEQEMSLTPNRIAFETDSIEAVCDLARAGAGVALAPRYLVTDDVATGRLLELDIEGGSFEGPDARLCYISRALQPRRVQALCEFLAETLPAVL